MQFLTNSTCVEQPVPGREHSGPEQPMLRREWGDEKGREAQKAAAKRQNGKRPNWWNRNGSAQSGSP